MLITLKTRQAKEEVTDLEVRTDNRETRIVLWDVAELLLEESAAWFPLKKSQVPL